MIPKSKQVFKILQEVKKLSGDKPVCVTFGVCPKLKVWDYYIGKNALAFSAPHEVWATGNIHSKADCKVLAAQIVKDMENCQIRLKK